MKVKAIAKSLECKRENKAPQHPKPGLSYSTGLPIDHFIFLQNAVGNQKVRNFLTREQSTGDQKNHKKKSPFPAVHSRNPADMARQPMTPGEFQEIRERFVRSAIDFINGLRETVALDRLLAQAVADRAAGSSAGSRLAHPILNQRGLRQRLQRGRSIYDAQHEWLGANEALQGELREAYANFLGEVREAFDQALLLAQHDRAAQLEEQSAYGESLVLWLEASPLRDEALSGRTSFTAPDAAASQRQENDLAFVLSTIVPYINLVQPNMIARGRTAIENTRNRITGPVGSLTRSMATGATQTAADAAVVQLTGAEHTIDRGRMLLQAALARMDVWLQAPTQPVDVSDRVNELFNTRDPGYGQLIRDRLQLMLTNLDGGGTLFAHMHRPGDTGTCVTSNVLGQMPRPYEFEFCGAFRNLDDDASVLLHELAHAVIPGRGSRGSAATDYPQDRAYAGERLLGRMQTEEALNNAESYWQLIAALSGIPRDAIPVDTATGFADAAPLLNALALAQSAHRRAWTYLQEARDLLRDGQRAPTYLQDLINTHLGNPSDADLLQMLEDFGDLQSNASTWHIGHSFVYTTGRRCPDDVLAFDSRRIYHNGTTTARSRPSLREPHICPAFFALSGDDQVRAAHALVSLTTGDSFLRRPQSVWGYAALALAIYQRDFGAPPASSLAEHQAADTAATTPSGTSP